MRVQQFFKSLLTIEPKDRYKLLCLSFAFLFIIGGYTIARTMKDTLFVSIVGREWIPVARLWSILILIPGVLIFSRLVDTVKRYQLIYIYSLFYGIGGLIIAFLLQHPTIGLMNTVPSSGRLFGWFIYLFIEGYNPFLVSVFWSFSHSVNSPEESKGGYPIMVAASKIGGALAAMFGYWFLSRPWCCTTLSAQITAHQVLLSLASCCVLLVSVCIYLLMKNVPQRNLHGYEAAYRAEKKEAAHEAAEPFSFTRSLYSLFSGLISLVQYPYALGIFAVTFFWEVINSFVSFERLGVVQDSLSARTCYLLEQDIMIHLIGFLFVIIGTRILVELLGERQSLILVPVTTGILLAYYFTAQSASSMAIVYVLLRVMNFAFAVPLRERLYTPTTKAIKFKSKMWIDSFGAKIAKGAGSGYNMAVMGLAHAAQMSCGIAFFSGIIGLWVIAAHFLGRTFERAVKRNEVIGLDKDRQTVAN